MPPLPKSMDYLWRIFHRLRRRKGGGFSATPVEWPDIDAFLRLTGTKLLPHEFEIIEELDDLWLGRKGE